MSQLFKLSAWIDKVSDCVEEHQRGATLGDRVDGLKTARAYHSGAALTWSAVRHGIFLLALCVPQVAQYLLDLGILDLGPAFTVFCNQYFGFLLVSLPYLVVVYLLYKVFVIKNRHLSVMKRLSDLNYKMSKLDDGMTPLTIRSISDLFCQLSTEIFQAELPRVKIGCAFRFRTDLGFTTVARKGHLSAAREENTKPLADDSLLSKVLHDPKYMRHRAFIISDTTEAFRDDLTDSNRHIHPYCDEDKSMIVSRVFAHDPNSKIGPEGGRDQLIGIFYITADSTNAFGRNVVDLHIFLRDYLNMIVLRVLDENQRNSRLEAQYG